MACVVSIELVNGTPATAMAPASVSFDGGAASAGAGSPPTTKTTTTTTIIPNEVFLFTRISFSFPSVGSSVRTDSLPVSPPSVPRPVR